MDRYVFLVKVLRGVDLFFFRDEVKVLVEKYGFEVEIYRCIGFMVDVVIVYNNGIVLIKWKNEFFKDYYVFLGGFVEYGEIVEEVFLCEVKEEMGFDVKLVKLVGVYLRFDRDFRGYMVMVVFFCIGEGELKVGDDVKEVFVFLIEEVLNFLLVFDYGEIFRDVFSLR